MSTIKENLIDLFELDKLPPEKAIEMTERLGKLVFQAVLVRVLPTLSEENLTKYEGIIAKNEGVEVMFKFLGEAVPNFEGIITEEAEALRADLAGEFEAAGI